MEKEEKNLTAREAAIENGKKAEWKDDLVWFAKALLIGCCIALFIRFVTPIIFVDGSSMDKTLYDKEITIGCTLLKPKTGDIIIFKNKYTNNRYYIKRVLGMPGESVDIERGTVTIDGEVLDESSYIYISEGNQNYMMDHTYDHVQLSDTQYFVCGDNRNNSNDSRYIGPVEKKDIKAVVVIRLDFRWFTNIFHKG